MSDGNISDIDVTELLEDDFFFFTDQFEGLELTNENTLNRKIDGISGATLSVNALTRLSKLALHLHKEAMQL
ncbi:MAG: FMN-binding protein [Opitutales bacterium]|nr:FMN-binding protein [Opitutales bacterium]